MTDSAANLFPRFDDQPFKDAPSTPGVESSSNCLDDLMLSTKTPPTTTPMQNLLLDRLKQYPTAKAEQLSRLFIATLNQIPPQP